MIRVRHLLLTILALPLLLSGCADDPREVRESRMAAVRNAFNNDREIYLGVVWRDGVGGFMDGAILAAEELNAAGGIAGRTLRLKMVDESIHLESAHISRAQFEGRYRNAVQQAGTDMARAIIDEPRIAAVIGHSDHEQTTLPAMQTYDTNGVLLISAGTTDPRVRWMESDLYFQLLPSDEVLVKTLAGQVVEQHWDKVHLVYANSRHNEQVAELLKSELAARKVILAGATALSEDVISKNGVPRRLQNSLLELREGEIDAVVLLAPPRLGAMVVRQARALGVAQPFIGSINLASPIFGQIANEDGAETLVASIYRNDGYLARRFRSKFIARFPGQEDDEWAALGYDSVRLYAQAVECAGTIEPRVIAHTLHFKLPLWYGLLGQYSFRNGENKLMRLHQQVLRKDADGKFKFVFPNRKEPDRGPVAASATEALFVDP